MKENHIGLAVSDILRFKQTNRQISCYFFILRLLKIVFFNFLFHSNYLIFKYLRIEPEHDEAAGRPAEGPAGQRERGLGQGDQQLATGEGEGHKVSWVFEICNNNLLIWIYTILYPISKKLFNHFM